jgi:chromosome segregation protein
VRLTQIKLSGFKSFVDPTSFHLPGRLVGVVGPNGCGKSNIIDAVRWVLGESKASELRGESMQDVIFNGSTNRKPSSRASVELVFDNSLARAGGQWNQYLEISVKRVLTRDGNSSYYINNQQVRRRDIQDIFLGTGLGPRAYAIIGQGMISRIIEARPEELRIFLEEAAGVSKYKERRRETENRLNDTRENLTRVEDILRELGTNLEKLESQAEVAQNYKGLQTDHDAKQQLLWALRKREAESEQQRLSQEVEKARNGLEEQTAALRRLEADLEQQRTAHYAASDAVHAAQGSLYEANSEVSRLESEIRFVVEARNRIQAQLAALQAQTEQWAGQQEQLGIDLAQAEETLAVAEENTVRAQDEAAHAGDHLPTQEAGLREAQSGLQNKRAEIAQTEHAIEVAATRQREADRQLQMLATRRERLQQEEHGLQRPDQERLEELKVEVEDRQAALAEAQDELAVLDNRLPELDAARREAQDKVQTESSTLTQLEARITALTKLQEEVQSHGKLNPWLEKHELGKMARLWQKLHIEPGWETALEAVLREAIAALEVSQLDWIKAFFNEAPPGRLAFFSAPPAAEAPAAAPGLKSLLSLVRIDDPALRVLLSEWLGHVYVADDAAAALAARSQLPPGGQFVVKAGHAIGRFSVRFYAPDSEQSGMLARQQEIENLHKRIKAQQLIADESRSAQIRADAGYNQSAQQAVTLRQRVSEITHRVHGQQLELSKLQQAAEQAAQRSLAIALERDDIAMHEEEARARKEEAEAEFERLDGELADRQSRFEDEQMALETLEADVLQARERVRQAERHAQEAVFAERSARSRIEELRRSIQFAGEQARQVQSSLEAGQAELRSLDDAAAQAGLQDALALRVEKEERLAAARTELDALTAALRAHDEQRLGIERGLEPLRERITELQLKEQAARLNQEQYAQQLADVQADLAALETRMADPNDPPPKPAWLQGEITRIANAIASLGAVNLAALDELTTARERKNFLDAQQADLLEAITTLEDAIRKIDKETRDLLQQTFEQVNHHFGLLFPQLFGGGQAKLMMTGEEILDAGVQVLAQPPGKKNSTIHLLSGGEKALTATALVFALFQLNPAPFCLLDEVDAPLDDANTERFCQMVKRMSAQTQFVFISHNKIAMEMGEQLIGVTMQEQGVSRIVAVDMDSAVRLTAEAA